MPHWPFSCSGLDRNLARMPSFACKSFQISLNFRSFTFPRSKSCQNWSVVKSISVLAVSTVFIAWMSEVLVGAIEPAAASLGPWAAPPGVEPTEQAPPAAADLTTQAPPAQDNLSPWAAPPAADLSQPSISQPVAFVEPQIEMPAPVAMVAPVVPEPVLEVPPQKLNAARDCRRGIAAPVGAYI